ncbi:hypothetical protein GCM10018772_20990 [Streptomyces fumanus]|uniref:Uncharacterized protein n=1 Tax=Streptomyces fumanus TaxID=67302 RepID=A0A919AB71_9ACTN|nr:hypothetical protein GCM10018772_20990 [Streptomyces fumanus]
MSDKYPRAPLYPARFYAPLDKGAREAAAPHRRVARNEGYPQEARRHGHPYVKGNRHCQ